MHKKNFEYRHPNAAKMHKKANKLLILDGLCHESPGYNFGSDRSFDNLYVSSINQNINDFISALKINEGCLG